MLVIDYNIEKLTGAINDFYNSTGVNISILKEDFSSLTNLDLWAGSYCKIIHDNPEGKRRCIASDRTILEKCRQTKKAEVHICHAGLVDVAVPIVYDDIILGYIILGQMKKEEDFSAVKKYISDLSVDLEYLRESYENMTRFDEERVESIANIATMLTKYIMLESMLRTGTNEYVEKAVSYINSNLEKPLSIKDISKEANVSKTALYKYFHEYFGCTVNEYINRKRTDKAVELLRDTDFSIEFIAQKAGFLSMSYFCRVFKAQKGITPLKFRRQK